MHCRPPSPGTPRTMDSSSLGARRRLRRNTANTTQQGRYNVRTRRRNDVTRCNGIEMRPQ